MIRPTDQIRRFLKPRGSSRVGSGGVGNLQGYDRRGVTYLGPFFTEALGATRANGPPVPFRSVTFGEHCCFILAV